MLLIKDTARQHFMSLPLFYCKIPSSSPLFLLSNECIFDKMRAYVLQFSKSSTSYLPYRDTKQKLKR